LLLWGTPPAVGVGSKLLTGLPKVGKVVKIGLAGAGAYATVGEARELKKAMEEKRYAEGLVSAMEFAVAGIGFGKGYEAIKPGEAKAFWELLPYRKLISDTKGKPISSETVKTVKTKKVSIVDIKKRIAKKRLLSKEELPLRQEILAQLPNAESYKLFTEEQSEIKLVEPPETKTKTSKKPKLTQPELYQTLKEHFGVSYIATTEKGNVLSVHITKPQFELMKPHERRALVRHLEKIRFGRVSDKEARKLHKKFKNLGLFTSYTKEEKLTEFMLSKEAKLQLSKQKTKPDARMSYFKLPKKMRKKSYEKTYFNKRTVSLKKRQINKNLDYKNTKIGRKEALKTFKDIEKELKKTTDIKSKPKSSVKPKTKTKPIVSIVRKPKILEKNKVIEDPIRDLERNIKIQNIPFVKIPLRFGQKKMSEQREKVNQLTTTEIKQLQTTSEINKIGRGFGRLKVSFVDFLKIRTNRTKTKKPKKPKIKIPTLKKEKKIQPLTFKKPKKSIVEWVYIFGKKYKKKRWF
ncbi:MAG: hypothetical protein J7K98_03355, partial [Candidatus Aenigmarchaeota archaeon]|nr:hypothetical protein [Candidatus Aenigmarchaeota archaeon]